MDSKQLAKSSKEPGLFIVATPIGNLKDITYRAVEVLKNADLVLCEDTRESKKLLSHYAISAPLESYNDHNGEEKRPEILYQLKNGKSIALISDAGTPLVSDPGYKLVQDALNVGIKVYPIPGASAVLAALVMSGMPSDSFTFAGFVDAKKFEQFAAYNSTLIFFEAANRLVKTLNEMKKYFANRTVSVCREITKMFEENKIGNFDELAKYYAEYAPKGEVVILLSPPGEETKNLNDIEDELKALLEQHSLKESAEIIGVKYGLSKKKVYELGVKFKN